MQNLKEAHRFSNGTENAKPKSYRRKDLIAPATGHPDCKRENGFIVSVPGFVR